MVIYRPQRGRLDEAMKEAKEFKTEQEMKEYIINEWNTYWNNNSFDIDDIVICDPPTNDDRNGWRDTRYVCVKRMGKEDYIAKYGIPQCIGMCATDYKHT